MVRLKHELWEHEDEELGEQLTFCLAGPAGDDARRLAGPNAKLIWTVEAGTNFEAMTLYYEFMGWGKYTTEFEWDIQPYPDDFDERRDTPRPEPS